MPAARLPNGMLLQRAARLPVLLVPPYPEVAVGLLCGPGMVESAMAILGAIGSGIPYASDESWHVILACAVLSLVVAFYVRAATRFEPPAF